MAKEKITIKMVSEKAKISKTTVSRYLNGKYEFMSAETRKRIEEVIEELDYRPNAMAQSLKNNKTGLIGLVVADVTTPFSAMLIKGVNDVCVEKSFQIIIVHADNDPVREREHIQSLIDRQVEGLIVHTTGENDDFIASLIQRGVKIVMVDDRFKNNPIDTVTTDYEKATAEMIKKVYAEGFERIGFFSQPLSHGLTQKKHDYFIEATENFVNHKIKLTYQIDENNRINEECYDLLQQFLNTHKGNKLAIFAENSVVMLNLMHAIYRLGLTIPSDIGLCGFDELGWTQGSTEGISIISTSAYHVGSEASKLLFKRIAKVKDQYKPKYIKVPVEVSIKHSTQITDNSFDKMVIKLNQENKPFIKDNLLK